MSDPRYRDETAVERRDRAQSRVRSITVGALAGGAMVTAVGAGLAVAYAPGRASTSPPPSSSSSSSSNASSTDPNAVGDSQFGDEGFQNTGQAPSFGGYGRGQAVSGGS